MKNFLLVTACVVLFPVLLVLLPVICPDLWQAAKNNNL